MAEFCLECYRKCCQPEDLKVAAVKLSDEIELCGGCGQFKQIVEEVAEPSTTRSRYLRRFQNSD